MMALTAAARAICYACAEAMDMSIAAPAQARRQWTDRASLLTPVAKAFASDAAIAVDLGGFQVHGGPATSRRPARQLLRRCAHLRDLRGHERHPGDRPRHPPAEARRRWRGRRRRSPSPAGGRATCCDRPAGIRPHRRTPFRRGGLTPRSGDGLPRRRPCSRRNERRACRRHALSPPVWADRRWRASCQGSPGGGRPEQPALASLWRATSPKR